MKKEKSILVILYFQVEINAAIDLDRGNGRKGDFIVVIAVKCHSYVLMRIHGCQTK